MIDRATPRGGDPVCDRADGEGAQGIGEVYQTGETVDRAAYDIAWVEDKASPVDTMNGFIEVYMDARGNEGLEALVFYVDPEKTAEIRKPQPTRNGSRIGCRGRIPQAGRDHHGQRHRRRHRNRRLGADHPGRHQPAQRSGDSQKYGSKSVSLSNVNEAYDRSTPAEFRREAWTPEEAARAEKWSSVAGELTTNMHEVIGHASGKVSEALKGSPQSAPQGTVFGARGVPCRPRRALLPARSEARAARLVDAKDHAEIVQAGEGYTRNALVQLRRIREGTQIEEDHMRNRQMIVRWLMSNSRRSTSASATGRRS